MGGLTWERRAGRPGLDGAVPGGGIPPGGRGQLFLLLGDSCRRVTPDADRLTRPVRADHLPVGPEGWAHQYRRTTGDTFATPGIPPYRRRCLTSGVTAGVAFLRTWAMISGNSSVWLALPVRKRPA